MKYSVIIPVYNAEKTIEHCLNSLVMQDYSDAEIIVVNDGSTDSSGMICQKYADRYDRIVYFPKENGGVSSARNAGLDIARGEYILFVDSDDYVAVDYFATLEQIPAEWDYVLLSYYVVNGSHKMDRTLFSFNSSDTDDYFLKLGDLISSKTLNGPCNKRFKRRIIIKNNICFTNGLSIGEDALFNLRYALACNSCCLNDHPVYYVNVENDQSLSRKPRGDTKEQLAIGEREMIKAICAAQISESNRSVLLSAMNFLQLSEIYSEAKRMHLEKERCIPRIRKLRRLCKELNQNSLGLPDSRYCRLLSIPVRFRFTVIIDLLGWIASAPFFTKVNRRKFS